MSAPHEPRIRYQAEFFQPSWNEWVEVGIVEKRQFDAHEHLRGSYYAPMKTRIVKQTTTFEVMEEMEPKCN